MAEFMAVFPDLVRDVAHDPAYSNMPAGTVDEHLTRCVRHVVPGGKRNRGLAVVASFRLLAPPSEVTSEESLRLACVLGWCVEFLQAYLLLADDIMDDSETRRGAPCWHRQEGRGLAAFNDAVLLEQCVYALLKKHFGDKTYYQVMTKQMGLWSMAAHIPV